MQIFRQRKLRNMKEEYAIFFHLGMPKVASTYLQRIIFPKLKNAQFYKKRKFLEYKRIDSTKLDTNIIFSSEKDRELKDALDDILRIHPEAKVILLLRSHEDWILSRYKYHIRKFGSYSFKEFIDIDSNLGYWKTEELLFSRKIEYILSHSKHSPLILNYDLLKSSPDIFVKKICDYIGATIDPTAKINVVVKKAFNEKQLLLLRKFNSIYSYTELETKYRLINRIHYRYREYLLHIMAFIFRFFPTSFSTGPLVEKNELGRIKEYYKDDWELCLKYMDEYSE